MTVTTAPYWSEVSGEARIGRRDLLVLSAAAAAFLLTTGKQPIAARTSPQDFVRSLSKTRWSWTVELAVLQRYGHDRQAALDLLWAALELHLDPAQRWRQKPSLRLYDLYAAAVDSDGRVALARLVTSRSSDPALLTRAALWSDPSRQRRSSIWHTTGPDGPIGIDLRAA